MHRKWPDVQEVSGLFSNFTNTHEKVEIIRERYEQAINEPGVVRESISERAQTVYQMRPLNIWLNYRSACM